MQARTRPGPTVIRREESADDAKEPPVTNDHGKGTSRRRRWQIRPWERPTSPHVSHLQQPFNLGYARFRVSEMHHGHTQITRGLQIRRRVIYENARFRRDADFTSSQSVNRRIGFPQSNLVRDHYRVEHLVQVVTFVRIVLTAAPGVGQNRYPDAGGPDTAHEIENWAPGPQIRKRVAKQPPAIYAQQRSQPNFIVTLGNLAAFHSRQGSAAFMGVPQDAGNSVGGKSPPHTECRQRCPEVCRNNAAEVEDKTVVSHVVQAYDAALNSRSLLPSSRTPALPDFLMAAYTASTRRRLSAWRVLVTICRALEACAALRSGWSSCA